MITLYAVLHHGIWLSNFFESLRKYEVIFENNVNGASNRTLD
jgi:hypothetical protein